MNTKRLFLSQGILIFPLTMSLKLFACGGHPNWKEGGDTTEASSVSTSSGNQTTTIQEESSTSTTLGITDGSISSTGEETSNLTSSTTTEISETTWIESSTSTTTTINDSETGIESCGDGVLDIGEECDDGNMMDQDACTNMCKNAICGDGITWNMEGKEQCDQGMMNDDHAACTSSCMQAFCGDGLVWNTDSGKEQCDDGNMINDDFCTNACAFATCNDKNKNGDETDVDCGGSCGGCALGKTCQNSFDCQNSSYCIEGTCQHPQSCKHLLELNPMLKSKDGMYIIDPDGMGGNQPLNLFCNMTYDEGGWTRVLLDDFGLKPSGWKQNNIDFTTVTTCGQNSFGKILGGYNTLGSNDFINKKIDLPNIEHTQLWFTADFIAIDSWDGNPDQAYAKIGNQWVWETFCDSKNNSCNQLMYGNQCGNDNLNGAEKNDGKIGIVEVKPHMENFVTVGFGSNLDEEDKTQKSWGVDNVAVYIR